MYIIDSSFIDSNKDCFRHQSSSTQQPDGSHSEDCSVIQLNSIRVTPTWHDIPCALKKSKRFICKAPSFKIFQSLAMAFPRGKGCPQDLHRCDSGECILKVHLCDGVKQCRRGSDEYNCNYTQCSSSQFRCTDGPHPCISISYTCDFMRNCLDNSDEQYCQIPKSCAKNEFRCRNGQCIPIRQKCDLIQQCVDGSDELQCEKCNTDVAMQCSDGSCLSKRRQCDGVVDCPGSYKEDELQCVRTVYHSCLDWRRKGYIKSGIYSINPNGLGLTQVECDMSSVSNKVATILHHNAEYRITVESQPKYQKQLTYFVTDPHIRTIKNMSSSCEQFLSVQCYNSKALLGSWYSIDREKVPFEDPSYGDNCSCLLPKACQERRKSCHCTTDSMWNLQDAGHIHMKDKLPMTAIEIHDADDTYEVAKFLVGPLKCYQDLDETLENMKCKNLQFSDTKWKCLLDRDQYGIAMGCRDASNLKQCENHTCLTGQLKCPRSYCIAGRLRCDGIMDCPMGEDEIHCDTYVCQGMYKCRNATMCIYMHERCDGNRQCPQGDDEVYCDIHCPLHCNCSTLSIKCEGLNLTAIPRNLPRLSRKLDFKHNLLHLTRTMWENFTKLAELIISNNQADVLPAGTFNHLSNLLLLDLSHNHLEVLELGVFEGLGNLKHLYLAGNNLQSIAAGAFIGVKSLPNLNLCGMKLAALRSNQFVGLESMKYLDVSNNAINSIEREAFNGTYNLYSLNISKNKIIHFEKSDFRTLNSLRKLQSDHFMFCCFVSDHVNEMDCKPARDALSSCSDLMQNIVLRASLWVLGFVGLLGNAFVIGRRAHQHGSASMGSVSSFLVLNLALADFLMGVYLISIATVDIVYRGRYIENSAFWKSSTACQFLGTLSSISSESSILTLCIITGDRVKNIIFPFKFDKMTLAQAKLAVGIMWMLTITISVIPVFPSTYFRGQFYSRSGVCVSLHITKSYNPGWEYSVAIFHGLNFIALLFISLSYAYMYRVIRHSTSKARSSKKKEVTAARKMTLVVLTDFLCWMPINIMGVLALSGMTLPGEIYAWTVVFILPVNSALNPILYTISSMGKGPKKEKNSNSDQGRPTTITVMKMIGDDEVRERPLQSFFSVGTYISLEDVYHVVRQVATIIQNAQSKSLHIGKIELEDVFIKEFTDGFTVVLHAQPIVMDGNPEEKYVDMEHLGRFVGHLLRLYTHRIKAYETRQ